MLFARSISPLVHYDGAQMHLIRDDLAAASGINVSLDMQRLYVSETLGQQIRVFDVNDPGGAEIARIKLESSPDNIDVAESGDLWVASHADTLALIKHFGDAASPAPSFVMRIRNVHSGAKVEPVYVDSGEEISAGSVGAIHDGKLIIGSITEPKIIICALSY